MKEFCDIWQLLAPLGSIVPFIFGQTPNIYGQFNDAHAGTYAGASGVLGWQQTGERGVPGITEVKWEYGNLILDVGFANSLFGSSATVQPNALQGLMIIKI